MRAAILIIFLAGCGAGYSAPSLEFSTDRDTGVTFLGTPGCVWVEDGVGLACYPCPTTTGSGKEKGD